MLFVAPLTVTLLVEMLPVSEGPSEVAFHVAVSAVVEAGTPVGVHDAVAARFVPVPSLT
jgi:hypothetical protein